MALLRLFSVPQRGVLVALLLTWAGAAQAQPERMGGMVLLRLSPALQQRLLPEQRQLALQDRRTRIAILRQGERCLAAAATVPALQACLRQEHQAVQEQRRRHQQAMLQMLKRHGIALPPEGLRPPLGPGPGPGHGAWMPEPFPPQQPQRNQPPNPRPAPGASGSGGQQQTI